jgi:GNAT superfamily N-acetyltransferase
MAKKLIRLTESDIRFIVRECINHLLVEGIDSSSVTFEEDEDEYGSINVSCYMDGDVLLGYMVLVMHDDVWSLESEISDTDSYETAVEVIRYLDNDKPVVELADVDVMKEYRSMGVSTVLLEYVLSKYSGCQFYLRVCPTGGVDGATLARSVGRHGFREVCDTVNGVFMVRR